MATPSRRKSIIRDAKYAPKFKATRYTIAREGIVNFLGNMQRNTQILYNAEAKLQAKKEQSPITPWQLEDYKSSIEVLQKFSRSYNSLGLSRYEIRKIPGRAPKLNIQDVSISVNPKLSIHRIDKNNNQRVGCLVINISKTLSSSKSRTEIAQTATATSFLFAENYLCESGIADHNICMFLDVFGGNLIKCPRAIKRRVNEINNACEEVSERWTGISPPKDYE